MLMVTVKLPQQMPKTFDIDYSTLSEDMTKVFDELLLMSDGV